jgi:hypothetical protein
VLDWDLMLLVHIEGEAVGVEPWPGIVEARTLAGPGLDSVSVSTARQRGFVRFAAT